ncbi:MAG: hypothetical protein SWQ30_12120 [Thermodesulfobacteriota bacterium]|nr:hypothetical protein [Thermodesulfobacteriota bacterium]
MKRAFFLFIAFAFLIPSQGKAGAGDPLLIHEEGSQVTYDSRTGLYWYYDLVRFTDKTYDEQLAEIENISVEGFTNTWHMATYREMARLWRYSAETLFSCFALTRDDPDHHQQYADGRYDEPHPEQAQCHYFAEVRLRDGTTYEKSQLNYLDVWPDGDSFDVLGAWVVYEGDAIHVPKVGQALLPAIMLLLSDPDDSQDPRTSRSTNRRHF